MTSILAATVLAVVLAACSGGGASSGKSTGAGKSNGQLIYGEGATFPENLLPIIAPGEVLSANNILARVLDGAYRITPQVTFQADPDQITGATSTTVNGQQVVDFKINPKAVWADGTPITAADYLFTWNEEKSQDPAAGGCADLSATTGFDQIESGVAVSDQEVKFTFRPGQPFIDWQGLFSGAGSGTPILSKHVLDKGSPTANCAAITAGWPVADGIPLGAQNGPWLLEKQNIDVAKKVVTLVPNPKYWGAKPTLARIVYANIGSDANTLTSALQNGEVNMIYPQQPTSDLLANVKKISNVTTSAGFGPSFEQLVLNTRDPLLAHPQVRQAIALVLDRAAIVKSAVGPVSSQASVLNNRLLVSNQTGYQDNSGGAYDKPNTAKAAQLLQSLGGTRAAGGTWTIAGKPLNFTVLTTPGDPVRDTTIQLMKQQLAPFGIGITENASADIFKASAPDSIIQGGFQIALFALTGGPALSGNVSSYESPASGGGQNVSYGADPVVDQDLKAMTQAPDPAAASTDANQADKQLWQDMFTLPLYQRPTLLAYDSNYTGIADNATQAGPLWNSDQFGVK